MERHIPIAYPTQGTTAFIDIDVAEGEDVTEAIIERGDATHEWVLRAYDDDVTCLVCKGIIPPEGVTMVPDDGAQCTCYNSWPTQEQFDAAHKLGTEYALQERENGATEPREAPLSGEWANDPMPAQNVGWFNGGEGEDEINDAWERGYFDVWAHS